MRWLGVLMLAFGLFMAFGANWSINHYSKARETKGTIFDQNKNFNSDISIYVVENKVDLEIRFKFYYVRKVYGPPIVTVFLRKKLNRDVIFSQPVFEKDVKISWEHANGGLYNYEFKSINVDPGEYELNVLVWEEYKPDLSWIQYSAKPILIYRNADFPFYGNIAMWLGAAMFVLGLRRRNRVASDAPPAPSKWGRGN